MELGPVMQCNCTLCSKRGALWVFIPPAQFSLDAGADDLRDYQFNRKVIHHLICPNCGVESFARGKTPDGSDIIAVNVRCLDDVDLDRLTVKAFDGRSL
jgi:hypothetical protein